MVPTRVPPLANNSSQFITPSANGTTDKREGRGSIPWRVHSPHRILVAVTNAPHTKSRLRLLPSSATVRGRITLMIFTRLRKENGIENSHIFLCAESHAASARRPGLSKILLKTGNSQDLRCCEYAWALVIQYHQQTGSIQSGSLTCLLCPQ